MSSPAYTGGMTSWGSVAAWQAETENANPEVAECGHTVDDTGRVVLEGETGEAYGNNIGTAVPITVEHVTTPVTKRTLPSGLVTNPLSSGRPRGR